MRSAFARFLSHTYDGIRAQNPLEGRRMWLLRAVDEFWASNRSKPEASSGLEAQDDPSADDEDPMDQVIDDVEAGIVLRTDFSNEDAWNSFLEKLKKAEEEHKESVGQVGQVGERGDDENSGAEGEEEDGDDGPGLLIKVIDASLPEERALFEGISNLSALRLFNDVDVRPAPPMPSGTKRTTPHRLVDRGGWQEVYLGITIWVYDAQSNSDHCLRLVNPEGDVYGTATGDSWRAQVSHVYELQFNMTFLGMKINFGGMDRWDFAERSRNLREVGE
ncbi:hypothetical protein BDZ89DRAFT_1066268 [Hymenopellis radicata]|nr:hypothetical protein BDZ89DRAFT_1066268 [Hymenopellis radicata]